MGGGLVRRALRDELCGAGGAPLVGSTVAGQFELAKGRGPFVQTFRQPPAGVLQNRVAAAAKRFGFRVVSLRVLRPLQSAPLLVVETEGDRREFGADIPAILRAVHGGAYEGFLFEARDADGPFFGSADVHRGKATGTYWGDARAMLSHDHGSLG